MAINIVIWVSGGNVTGVSTDLANADQLNVLVADADNAEGNTDDPLFHLNTDGHDCTYVVGGELVGSEPDVVQRVLDFYLAN